ncbi:MAG: hypothetical protein KC474_09540 [Cyanobacteria bacterium HKST-UBA04]|nr:hypothetical protein [Cyanobacteria bacterium HKST-UBA04]MCA9841813.1 hypothetical protein [Cyanobacteria bacterium HKST-UBA03]
MQLVSFPLWRPVACHRNVSPAFGGEYVQPALPVRVARVLDEVRGYYQMPEQSVPPKFLARKHDLYTGLTIALRHTGFGIPRSVLLTPPVREALHGFFTGLAQDGLIQSTPMDAPLVEAVVADRLQPFINLCLTVAAQRRSRPCN